MPPRDQRRRRTAVPASVPYLAALRPLTSPCDRRTAGTNRRGQPKSHRTTAGDLRGLYSRVLQHDDGTWEGDLRPDQLVLREVLDLEPLRQRIAQGTRRDEALAGKVERPRGALGSKPLLAGTRVPVETVRRYVAAGRSTDDVLEASRSSRPTTWKRFGEIKRCRPHARPRVSAARLRRLLDVAFYVGASVS